MFATGAAIFRDSNWGHQRAKLGLKKNTWLEGLIRGKGSIDDAVKQLEKLGAEIVEISLPHTDYAVATTILLRRRKRARIWRSLMAFGMARVEGKDPIELYSKTRAGFGRKSNVGSSSEQRAIRRYYMH